MSELIKLIREKSLKLASDGEFFTLSSGKKSTYFVDCKKATLDARGIHLIAEAIADIIKSQSYHNPIYIAGVALGGCPLATAVSMLTKFDALFVRTAAKDHGTKQLIEGSFVPGKQVVLLEDVITTGASTLSAINILEDAGLRVVHVLCVIDRLEGGRKLIEERTKFDCLLTINQVLGKQ